MDAEKEAAIRAAAVAYHEASERQRWLAAMNRPRDAEKAAEQYAEYALAVAMAQEAYRALRALQEAE